MQFFRAVVAGRCLRTPERRINRRRLSVEPLEARTLLSVTTAIGESIELNPATHTDIQATATVQSTSSSENALAATSVAAPGSYDLRALGDVTSVRNQGYYGTCWAFASYASLESSLLKASNTSTDLSERNLAYRHGFDWGYSDGGNSYISEAYLSRFSGPISESDDPYRNMGTADNVTGPAQYYVREMLRFDSRSEIKNALMTYGAVYTGMYWDSARFRSSDCTYYYNGSGSNHAVTIIGWDDSKQTAGGTGAWLVKNSWGTGWADGGYFWLSYQDSGGRWAESFCNAVSADTYSKAYYYDTFGDVGEINTPYAFNRYVATSASELKSVGFYTAADGASYSISVYDTFSGGKLSDLLATVSGTQTYAGYHTVDMASVVSLYAGNDFYVSLHILHGGDYPMAVDYRYVGYSSASSASAGQSYYSYNGTTWTDLTTWESTANFCIKALVQESVASRTATGNDGGSFHGDFNGDGTDDILWQNQDTGLVTAWIISNGAVTNSVDIETIDPAVWQVIGVGDVDGDGTDDILGHNQDTGLVGAWIMNNGAVARWVNMGTADPSVWRAVGVGDFNGDGTDDVLWQNQNTGLVGAWIMNSGVITRWAGMGAASPSLWHVVGIGDLNGDRTDDILWQNQSTGVVATWMMNNGRVSLSTRMGAASLSTWQIVGIGDFNGDSTDDVLWQNRATGYVVAWTVRNGRYSRTTAMGTLDPIVWQVVGAGDYNGNGTSDVLWCNQSTGGVGAWIVGSDGSTSWLDMGTTDPAVWQVLGGGSASGPPALQATTVLPATKDVQSLTESNLKAIIAEAVARWTDDRLNAPASMATLAQVAFAVDDLCGPLLDTTVGKRATIDVNTAGHDRIADSTSAANMQCSAASRTRLQAGYSRAVDRIDLPDVAEHELGHILSQDNLDSLADDLMGDLLIRNTFDKDHVDAVLAAA